MDPKSFAALLEEHLRPATMPVAVRLAPPGEEFPGRARSPGESLNNRQAVCQGVTLARTLGWAMKFSSSDHGCPLAKVFIGHIAPERFLSGDAAGYYHDDPDVCRLMEARYPRREVGSVGATFIAPLAKAPFEPDLALVYGTPAQIMALIQAANFNRGTGVTSTSMGRCGCATWLAGVHASGECTFYVPGPGERIFAGTQDHEMAFVIPAHRFEGVAKGLDFVRKNGAYRYPVPNLQLLNEPKMPAKYLELDPDMDTERPARSSP